MGCLSRLVVIAALAVQVIASGLGLIVFGSAGVLGNAAIISAEDALIVFIALVLSLIATVVISIKLWLGSRKRKRLEQALAATSLPAQQVPSQPIQAANASQASGKHAS